MKSFAFVMTLLLGMSRLFASEPAVHDLWPGKPPGETKELRPKPIKPSRRISSSPEGESSSWAMFQRRSWRSIVLPKTSTPAPQS